MSLKYKIIILFLITITAIIPSLSYAKGLKCDNTKSLENFCPKEPCKISNIVLRGMQYVSGLNYVASKFAEFQIKKQILKHADGDFNVDIDSFSALDLASGKLKSLKIDASHAEVKELYFKDIKAQSVCDYIHIDYKAKPVKLKQPLTVRFSGTITENGLNKTVQGQVYKNHLIKVKHNNNEFKLFEFINSRATIKNNRMQLMTDLKFSSGGFRVPLYIDSGLNVIEHKLKMTDARISTGGINFHLKLPDNFLDMINPLVFNLRNIETKGKKISFNNVSIINNKINIDFNLWLPKTKDGNKISTVPN